MAPPKLFINTKTLDVEKQRDHLEKDIADGLRTESTDGIKTSAVEKSGCSFFCLRFVAVSCIGLGFILIATEVSFDQNSGDLSSNKIMSFLQAAFISSWTLEGLPLFFYFLTLGLHMILIGFHLLFGWGWSGGARLVKIWSTSLAKWVLENPKRGKVLIGSVIFVTEGLLFAFLELSFLVSIPH